MTFSNADIIAMSKGHFFGEGNAQLPSDQMLMIDEISHIDDKGGKYNKGLLKASLAIRPDHWFFACHFQGDPVMPGCLGLDALWQLLGGGWVGQVCREKVVLWVLGKFALPDRSILMQRLLNTKCISNALLKSPWEWVLRTVLFCLMVK